MITTSCAITIKIKQYHLLYNNNNQNIAHYNNKNKAISLAIKQY